jgi:hypothetical protein
MHAFITLHRYYRGSPPPRLHPQIFGSWLFYYGSSAFSAPHAYNSPQMGKIELDLLSPNIVSLPLNWGILH